MRTLTKDKAEMGFLPWSSAGAKRATACTQMVNGHLGAMRLSLR